MSVSTCSLSKEERTCDWIKEWNRYSTKLYAETYTLAYSECP